MQMVIINYLTSLNRCGVILRTIQKRKLRDLKEMGVKGHTLHH